MSRIGKNKYKNHSLILNDKLIDELTEVEKRLVKQYPMPKPDELRHPYRLLHPHEVAQEGDEVWNFHFGEFCQWKEVVDAAVDEYEKHGYRKPNPIVISPRLNIVRTTRPPNEEFETRYPVIEED